MPSRIIPFVNSEFYHTFNRGVAKMQIFNNFHDYNRFIKTIIYYSIEGPKPKFSTFTPTTTILNTNKIIDIICYCLMPNHFHFLLRQKRKGGITEFMSKIANSYTKYFNTKNKRVGPLLQGEFKSVHIESNEQLLHISRYIHLNPLVGYKTQDLSTYQWSSYPEYTDTESKNLCLKTDILGQFKTKEEYSKFVLDQKDYAIKLEMIKHQLLDFEE